MSTLEFVPIDQGNLYRICQLLSNCDSALSDSSRLYLPYNSSEKCGKAFAEVDGCGIIRDHVAGRTFYTLPFGNGRRMDALRKLVDGIEASGAMPMLGLLEERDLAELGEGWLVSEFDGNVDFVYRSEDLAQLNGRKYHQKRTFARRFEELGPWEYRSLAYGTAAEFARDARIVRDGWIAEKGELEIAQEVELEALDMVLDAIENGGVISHLAFGGILYSNGKPVAFAIGEIQNPKMVLLAYEKAISNIPGAFAVMAREFCRHHCGGYEYVNFSDAYGSPNMAKAKWQWHPATLLVKHFALKTPVEYATERDIDELVSLWSGVFGDAEAAIRFFLGNRLTKDNCLVLRKGGAIVSACFLLRLGEGIRYVYALMTRPDLRDRGYATTIIETALSLDCSTVAIVPESAENEAFFAKLGFEVSSPPEHRRIAVDDFSKEFYRLCGDDGDVYCDFPTMTFPRLDGYRVPIPMN